MAKISFGKILTGITVIGAGVALGLAIYNKLDTLSYEDEYLDDDDFDEDFDDFGDDYDEESPVSTYVTLKPSTEDAVTEDATSEETTETETKEDTNN